MGEPTPGPAPATYVLLHRHNAWQVLRHYGYFKGVPIYLDASDAFKTLDAAIEQYTALETGADT
jgi:hypothetical protein